LLFPTDFVFGMEKRCFLRRGNQNFNYYVSFEELYEKVNYFLYSVAAKKGKTTLKVINFFGGGGHIFHDFRFSWGGGMLEFNPGEKRRMSVCIGMQRN
jgi:hypothetical protein